ncbi:MAG: twin-arginine translocase TatA/TatE family subunit [Pelagibacterales bacterium]|nr:twin-arginine translocase TatA/TatE family subunit [Pelagibacterales bacterium]
MSPSLWQIAVVIILVVLLFGRGKISSLMGDVAKGIKSFKKGMASDVSEEDAQKNISENQDTSVNQDTSENQETSENQDIDKKE